MEPLSADSIHDTAVKSKNIRVRLRLRELRAKCSKERRRAQLCRDRSAPITTPTRVFKSRHSKILNGLIKHRFDLGCSNGRKRHPLLFLIAEYYLYKTSTLFILGESGTDEIPGFLDNVSAADFGWCLRQIFDTFLLGSQIFSGDQGLTGFRAISEYSPGFQGSARRNNSMSVHGAGSRS